MTTDLIKQTSLAQELKKKNKLRSRVNKEVSGTAALNISKLEPNETPVSILHKFNDLYSYNRGQAEKIASETMLHAPKSHRHPEKKLDADEAARRHRKKELEKAA